MKISMRHKRHTQTRTQVSDELLCVVVYQPTLLDSLLNSSEVGIGENHVCCELRDVSSASHCNTDVGLLQGRSVIDAITGLFQPNVSPCQVFANSKYC